MALPPIRRVVTGVDSRGKAIIASDGLPPIIRTSEHRPGFSAREIWITGAMPASTREKGEPTDRPRSIQPPPNGTVCRIADFPPDATFIGKVDRAKAIAAYADQGSPEAVAGNENAPHPFMHKTETVDYGIVLSGEIYLVLDESETLLKAGDVVVQLGTNHAWSNRSNGYCRMAFILVDGTWDA